LSHASPAAHGVLSRGTATALTFEPHPLAVVKPDAVPKLIASPEIKRDLIAGLGVEELVVIPFNEDFSHKSAQQFIDEVLVDKLRATHVSVGENFTFGMKAQ